jgi:MFS transporter, SHS family, lactate transporter
MKGPTTLSTLESQVNNGPHRRTDRTYARVEEGFAMVTGRGLSGLIGRGPDSGKLTPDQRNAFLGAFLGWTMDAFDYFIVVLVYADIAKEFHVSLTRMAFLTTVTLIMRPVGAMLFGLWAERAGRRIPLMVDVLFYSMVGFACAFAPNFTTLLVLRLLYGIGMGGEWGLGAALAMEKIPAERRGFFSGVLQEGYSFGYILAALAYLVIDPIFGWRGMFAFSLLPAFISLLIRSHIRESEAWEQTQKQAKVEHVTARQIFFKPEVLRRFVYLVALMTAFNWMSHGTQDIYPTFLKGKRGAPLHGAGLTSHTAIAITIVFNLGAITGGVLLGSFSERLGRRRTIMVAAACALPIIPLFAYSHMLALLFLGPFMMQFFVQGAWGVIPAHLTELSPGEIRAFYPGVTYQLGNLIASLNLPIQQRIAASHGYPAALTWTMVPVLITVIILAAVGSEARGANFGKPAADAADEGGGGVAPLVVPDLGTARPAA